MIVVKLLLSNLKVWVPPLNVQWACKQGCIYTTWAALEGITGNNP